MNGQRCAISSRPDIGFPANKDLGFTIRTEDGIAGRGISSRSNNHGIETTLSERTVEGPRNHLGQASVAALIVQSSVSGWAHRQENRRLLPEQALEGIGNRRRAACDLHEIACAYGSSSSEVVVGYCNMPWHRPGRLLPSALTAATFLFYVDRQNCNAALAPSLEVLLSVAWQARWFKWTWVRRIPEAF